MSSIRQLGHEIAKQSRTESSGVLKSKSAYDRWEILGIKVEFDLLISFQLGRDVQSDPRPCSLEPRVLHYFQQRAIPHQRK